MGKQKRIYIAYTGGTIGMRWSSDGFAPSPGFLERQMSAMAELRHPSMPAYVISEYDPLLDSANMGPRDWYKIALDIADHYEEFDGFVVLHGTDTMAYSASALSFMLQGLTKPVIFTGAQLPLSEPRSDGRDNLVTTLLLAAECGIPEVCLYFGNKLLRGNRSVKVNAGGFDAFDSPNFPPLGLAGAHLEIAWHLVRRPPDDMSLIVQPFAEPIVASVRLFPGISAVMMRNILRSPLQGLVLETYGAGTGPDRDAGFLSALEEASARGVVIVACTQCLRGSVNLNEYAAGAALARVGVISGHDMTPEAALTKLLYLFGCGLSPYDVKRLMAEDLRGELSPLSGMSTPAHEQRQTMAPRRESGCW